MTSIPEELLIIEGKHCPSLQDYIPQEELAKFLAKSGSEEAKAQAEALEAASRIQSDNVGHRLLSQMGWKEGQGLGAQGKGMAAPVAAASGFASEKRGLGAEDHLAPQEGDDEFEAYRKRMMLGYKHRCCLGCLACHEPSVRADDSADLCSALCAGQILWATQGNHTTDCLT